MFREFLTKNSSSLLIIAILLGGLFVLSLFSTDDTARLVKEPKKGQIYIFEEDNVYAPMRIDSIGEKHIYMRNYLYFFADAIPARDQILAQEFDLAFFAIYERTELNSLFEEGKLVKIYP
mgnify:CR=1 FL=1